ncbi:MAG: hypothetical protein MI976_27015, partial [Pseudomonadales bacterium]|nr:hypothetical protein [Pseudomonadales bacterium]
MLRESGLSRAAVLFFTETLVIVLLVGCGGSKPNQFIMGLPGQGVETDIATFVRPKGGNFYANGFPTNLRQQSDGSIDLTDFPRQIHWMTDIYADSIAQWTQGYHTVMPIYLPFTNALDVEALSDKDIDYVAADSPIQLIDIDQQSPEYGRRFPLQVSMTKFRDPYRPKNLLQVYPTLGVNLRPRTTYAVVVTAQAPLTELHYWQQSEQLKAVLMPGASEIPAGEETLAVYRPLRDYLDAQAIEPDSIVAATVWTTGDPFSQFYRATEQVGHQAENLPKLPISALEAYAEYPEYCVVRGTIEIPGYQKGRPPFYLLGGEIEWGAEGEPVPQYSRAAEFVVTIPKNGVMPADGYPILSYVHGAGGRAHQVYDRGEFHHFDLTRYPYYIGADGEGPAQIAAERGWAASGLAGHLSFDQIGQLPSLNGFVVYNLFNPVGLYGSYMTMVWERVYFRRIVDRIEVDTALCPEADAGPGNTVFRFDPNMQVNLGQSQGNWVSALMVAADPRPYQGVIFSGAAGNWTRLYNNNPGFEAVMNTGVINRIPIRRLDDAHPFLMLMEWLLGPVDTTANLDSVMRYAKKMPPHVIGFSGFRDYFLSEESQRPFFMALGS